MSFSVRSLALASFLVVVCALGTVGCGRKKSVADKPPPAAATAQPSVPASMQASAPASGQSSAPAPLPEAIVKAWTQAGGAAGWFRQAGPVYVMFLPTVKSPKAGDVPAFAFDKLPEGVLAKLPPPQQPFGLEFGSEGSQVTDASLKGIARMDRLHTLYLGGSKVTDAGLRELAGLKELQRLSLTEQVTDAGLKQLAGLKSLQTLHASDAKVTDAGVQELQKALPSCKIIK